MAAVRVTEPGNFQTLTLKNELKGASQNWGKQQRWFRIIIIIYYSQFTFKTVIKHCFYQLLLTKFLFIRCTSTAVLTDYNNNDHNVPALIEERLLFVKTLSSMSAWHPSLAMTKLWSTLTPGCSLRPRHFSWAANGNSEATWPALQSGMRHSQLSLWKIKESWLTISLYSQVSASSSQCPHAFMASKPWPQCFSESGVLFYSAS